MTTIPRPVLEPQEQRALLGAGLPPGAGFVAHLQDRDLQVPRRGRLRVLQLNLGKLCNMTCSHCHVEAGPHQGHTQMPAVVVEQCIAAIQRLRPAVVDLTGGAPELHQQFRQLVRAARDQGCHVIDRCNLTVLLLPALADLAGFLAEQQVEIVASLPKPEAAATDAQRGEGTWESSIEALRRLNALGYGLGHPNLPLTLMSNPSGTQLQHLTACDEQAWKQRLQAEAGVSFDNLIGLNNMPIARFLQQLDSEGQVSNYLSVLQEAFNPLALCGLMCRDTLSVAPDGHLYDCDFNQMLHLPISPLGNTTHPTIATITADHLEDRAIAWGNHCFGCTAGQGSSCAGSTQSVDSVRS
ncbi:arsenosugar biosynthesis radical SAM protein ArsS [Synechococcus sp. HJ21-Hayes]|jgi:radical SAM/Cys-rich protein|uniref:arsenosugar biosynthesis radical SAM (seleno)protein ArsS n=1 Tax=unclassified Synechococcus TaxID=2626047 RepID=UPI0020CF74C4|nr:MULTISPECIES: arsenosugar biosynthesis radical SAM (seleno)protein ArsS [unclassified Synechococcus]MCP9832321.1 arsenosugar biosynthesis radical SAM protein ArsS [Synechococcus sp. JJ3a-Johnson]MCP9853562.1 arsenosugar biosynthesis radical SAM protein ArsS [Synechococcus sp. HJ21-Hayes]